MTYNKIATKLLHVWHHKCQQLKDITASLPHPIKWRPGHYGNIMCCLVLRTTYKNYEIHQHSWNWSSYSVKIRLKSKHINGFVSAVGSQKQPEAQWKQAENSFTLRQPMMFYEQSETECLLYCSTTIHQVKLNSQLTVMTLSRESKDKKRYIAKLVFITLQCSRIRCWHVSFVISVCNIIQCIICGYKPHHATHHGNTTFQNHSC